MKILRNKSGISLLFVLGLMLVLMAIGVSVLTASGLAAGARIAQFRRTQLDIHVSGTEQSILAALPVTVDGLDAMLNTPNTIGDLIISNIVNDYIFTSQPGVTPHEMYILNLQAQGVSFPARPNVVTHVSTHPSRVNFSYNNIGITTPDEVNGLTQILSITGWVDMSFSSFDRADNPLGSPPDDSTDSPTDDPTDGPTDSPTDGQPGTTPGVSTPLSININTGRLTATLLTTYNPTGNNPISTSTWVVIDLTQPIVLTETGYLARIRDQFPVLADMVVDPVNPGQWGVYMRGTTN